MDKDLESVINEHNKHLDAYQKCVDSHQKALDVMAGELKKTEKGSADKSERMRKRIDDLKTFQDSFIGEQTRQLDAYKTKFESQMKELQEKFEKAEKKKVEKWENVQEMFDDLLKNQSSQEEDSRQNLKKSFARLQEKLQENLLACQEDKDKQVKELKLQNSVLEKLLEDKEKIIVTSKELVDQLMKNQETQKQQTKTVPGLIQVLNQNNGKLSTEVETDLVARLKMLKTVNQVKLCRRPNEVSTDLPLLIVCIVLSRPGADALAAINDVPASSMTILAMFHHKDSHLPIPSSVNSLNGPEFKTLQGIYDFAFFSGKGIYNCQKNTESLKTMSEFICNYMKYNCL